jgi:acyl-CoA ligase (AMP-forming) (exosortase A-associated)
MGLSMAELIHELITEAARRRPAATVLRYAENDTAYAALATLVDAAAHGLVALGLRKRDRVAIYLDKREENVVAMFGAAAAGCAFVPINPLLKPEQVAYILRDCGVRVLLSSCARLDVLGDVLRSCPDLCAIASVDPCRLALPGVAVLTWRELLEGERGPVHRSIESDLAALLYTSGSSGKPKGVALSHRNLVAGARSVARYLSNTERDRILSVLPLSFDYGLSQLTSAFASGATVVLMNHLLMRDIRDMVDREAITGLAGVPTMWSQLAALDWRGQDSLRYITSSGGAMPRPTLDTLRAALPRTEIYLMYGLTEAFRSTFLAPDELACRPDSIGKAVPNAEVFVLRPDGQPCAPGEEGELVHRGPLVAMGYWNDAARTAERFRPFAAIPGLPLAETAVWSGDTVRADEEGFLYFVGRSDDMIKTAGYRVSPGEIEEVLYATGLVGEAVALGVAHPVLGQVIAVVATPAGSGGLDSGALVTACRKRLPSYMLPALVEIRPAPLPRNQNGKIDRRLLSGELAHLFAEVTP